MGDLDSAAQKHFQGVDFSPFSISSRRGTWPGIAMMAAYPYEPRKMASVLVLLSFQVFTLCLSATPLLAASSLNVNTFATRDPGQHPDGQITERKADDPVAKIWPEEFSINYTTNYGSASGFLAYDWAKQRQIMYHGPQSPFCASLGTEDPCQVYEYPGGTYIYVPSIDLCLLSNGEVGSLPPEWTTYSDYIGVEDIPGVGLCRGYAFPPTAHVWYETLDESLPCKFVFPDPSMSFYFDPDSLVLGSPDEKYFDVPDVCLSSPRFLTRPSAL